MYLLLKLWLNISVIWYLLPEDFDCSSSGVRILNPKRRGVNIQYFLKTCQGIEKNRKDGGLSKEAQHLSLLAVFSESGFGMWNVCYVFYFSCSLYCFLFVASLCSLTVVCTHNDTRASFNEY